jgi:hypothetical protein
MRMKRLLLIAAGIGLATSGASACEFQRSAKAAQVDTTVVASIAVPQSEPVALPQTPAQMPQQIAPVAE